MRERIHFTLLLKLCDFTHVIGHYYDYGTSRGTILIEQSSVNEIEVRSLSTICRQKNHNNTIHSVDTNSDHI